jgi:hypothetical protein
VPDVADFPSAYAAALSTQHWESVAPLIHPQACVTFSGGAFHRGIHAIESAYRRNFSLISGESFRMSELHWVTQSTDFAAYCFRFDWTGSINGELASGFGRGTTLVVRTPQGWQLMAEHLGPTTQGP